MCDDVIMQFFYQGKEELHTFIILLTYRVDKSPAQNHFWEFFCEIEHKCIFKVKYFKNECDQ